MGVFASTVLSSARGGLAGGIRLWRTERSYCAVIVLTLAFGIASTRVE